MAPIPDPPSSPGPEWKEVLAFVREQGEADRKSFDRMFQRTIWFLGVILAVLTLAISLLARWSIGRSMAEAKAVVRERVTAEFDTPRIREPLNDVAKQKYSTELQKLMAVRFNIEYVGGDSEACAYANQYLTIFRSAGWKDYVQVVQVRSIPELAKRFGDMIILVTDAGRPTAIALAKMLEEAWPTTNFPILLDPAGSSNVPRLIIPLKPM